MQATHTEFTAISVYEILIVMTIISPAQFADNGLGCLTQVRRILEHTVQNLGINLLRLRTGKGRTDKKREKNVITLIFQPSDLKMTQKSAADG